MLPKISLTMVFRGFVLDFIIPEFTKKVTIPRRLFVSVFAASVIIPFMEYLHPFFFTDGVRAFLLFVKGGM